jgi:hypothetical protein
LLLLTLLFLHLSGKFSAVEVDVGSVADSYLGGVAEDVAGGVGGYGVAAFQDPQGAALF